MLLFPQYLYLKAFGLMVVVHAEFAARNSAFRVAMEVLNSENRSYHLVPYVQNSKCDWQASQLGAEAMLHPFLPPLIGTVGPACSGAAMSAARVFWPIKFPLVSFAATTEVLSDRKFYPNFFRTV